AAARIRASSAPAAPTGCWAAPSRAPDPPPPRAPPPPPLRPRPRRRPCRRPPPRRPPVTAAGAALAGAAGPGRGGEPCAEGGGRPGRRADRVCFNLGRELYFYSGSAGRRRAGRR
ncbi:hypothetical protein E2320_000846, partial [Naja naja]